MICLSQKLTQLIEISCKKAFNFPPLPISVEQTALDSEYDYVSSISKDLFEKHRMDMNKYWKGDQLFSSGIAYEISTQMPQNPFVARSNVDSQGQLNFRLRDEYYLQGIKKISSAKTGQQISVEYDRNESGKCAIVFPFGQIAEKPQLNTFRGANISETMARIQQTLGDIEVMRVGVIQNAQPFHGIIYAFLRAEQKKQGKIEDQSINFEKLAQFIVENGLSSQEEVANFGASQINKLKNDQELKDVMEKLTNAAIGNYSEVFSKWTPQEIKIVREDTILPNTDKFIQQCLQRSTFIKQGNHQINYQKNQEVTLVDPVGALTREGFYLGLIKHLNAEYLVKDIHVASDLHDEGFNKIVSQLLSPCGIDSNLHFHGHNNLFSEQTDKIKINTLQELFSQMKQLNILKYKQNFPNILPSLIEEQSELFLDQCLGWTRYLDHRKSRKTPYIMGVNNVLQFVHNNEKLTNSRMSLLEILQSYPQHKGDMSALSQNFSFSNSHERTFIRVLLYFPDILHKCLISNEFNHLVKYTELLLGMVDFMTKQNIFRKFDAAEKLSEDQIANRIVLLDCGNKVLHKLFYIIGILNY